MQADAAGRVGIIGETAGHNGFDVTLAVLAAEAPSVVHNILADVAGKGGTTLYRAVGPAELTDIQKTGVLRNLGSAEGKYFTTSTENAAS
jgi:hypothetical protein